MVQKYVSKLGLRETEKAIKLVKDSFERHLAAALNLERVSAPLIVTSASGLNDNLNGVERIVNFDIKNIPGVRAEIVQSLAKWKRNALKNYGFGKGEGLYTDMNAIRCDDDVDCLHSIYVDQWDWEMVIDENDRNLGFLQETVTKIAGAVCDTHDLVLQNYPCLTEKLSREVFFITTQQLEDMYPCFTAKQREYEITKKHKTVCLMQIGGKLKSGVRHDGRAPDYDDWALNCDILIWQPVIEQAVEISSMGIRVSPESLKAQLKLAGAEDRAELPFHNALLKGELPFTIGGGIGQSRLCLIMLGKAHIGEVQASVWPKSTIEDCKSRGIHLL